MAHLGLVGLRRHVDAQAGRLGDCELEQEHFASFLRLFVLRQETAPVMQLPFCLRPHRMGGAL